MSRQTLVLFVTTVILAFVPIAEAQQVKKVPRIGYLRVGGNLGPRDEAFLQGLRQLGYVEGKNIGIEYRGDPQRREDRLPELAADLVRLKVDVIVALDPPSARAAKNATQ